MTLAEESVVVDLIDIYERAEFECENLRSNGQRQGQWRNVYLLAKRALRTLKALPKKETK